MVLLASIIIAVVVLPSSCTASLGNVHTSAAAVAKLAVVEDQVVALLQQYLQQEEQRLSVIRRYVESWPWVDMVEVNSPVGKICNSEEKNSERDQQRARSSVSDVSNTAGVVSNPIAGYHLLRRVTLDYSVVFDALDVKTDWSDVRRNLTSLKEGAPLPQEDDVNGAALALVRLQDTYNLPFDDLLEGRILDAPQAPQLSAEDCLRFGQQSFANLEFELGERWTQQGLQLLRSKKVKSQADQHRIQETERAVENRRKMRNMVELLAKDTSEEVLDEFSGMGLPGSFQKTVYSMRDGSEQVDELTENVQRLCRGELLQSPELLSTFQCGYVQESSWYGLLVRYKAELVWPDPLVLLFHDVISDAEIREVKAIAEPQLKTTEVHSFVSHKKMKSLARIGQTAWVPHGRSKRADDVVRRVESMTGLSTTSAEDMHVLNYGVGGHYDIHVDFFNLHNKTIKGRVEGGDRMATVLFYLNDVEAGGMTVFPALGIGVACRRGSALYWHNLKRSGAGHYATVHASCPVLLGEKWIANLWLREEGQEWRLPCSLDPDL